MANGLRFYLAVFIIVWLVGFLYLIAFYNPASTPASNDNNVELEWKSRLDQALNKLEKLEAKNRDNEAMIKRLK